MWYRHHYQTIVRFAISGDIVIVFKLQMRDGQYTVGNK